MFLKRLERRKSGKQHTYWALVQSVRTARGSRHRVVAYLGELKKSEQNGWAQLGRRLNGHAPPPASLFDPPHYDDPSDDEPVLVRPKGIRLERLRDFGDVWLALGLWRLLGLDALLSPRMPEGREDVPWPVVAAIPSRLRACLAIARFCEPSSELHIAHTWYRRTALPDLLGVAVEPVNDDRLYTGLDQLLPHKEAIEKHLKERLGDLFDLKFDLLLYDVTSTYPSKLRACFEGQCVGNPMAKRGYSRDQRPDCLQVCIGLVVTTDGIPLGYEVFDGNKNDSKTVEEIVQALEKKYGQANRVWVMDRGMVSEANLKFLRERGGSYIVGTPKAMLRRFEQYLVEKDWQEVQAGVEVKLVPGPDGAETFILARSADRREKEQAIPSKLRAWHQRFVERMEAGLKKLQAAAEGGRLKTEAQVQQRLGRLHERYRRATRAFDVKITPVPEPVGKARVSVTWERNTRWTEWTTLSEGCYLLRTNPSLRSRTSLTDTDAPTLWKRYTQLTEAEWAFRIDKDELEIRPIWHRKEDRVKAHILVCFLAFCLWKTLAQWMRRAGLGDAPRTLIEELAKIKSGDVVLPARLRDGSTRTIRLRCVTTPDEAQKVLLNRLGLSVPQRLRRIDEVESVNADEGQL